MSGVIEARGLTKTFYSTRRSPGFRGALRAMVAPRRVAKTAVRDVSFTVHSGELVALLGPNGAGKSTTMKLLTGIVVPTSGEARVAGFVPQRDRERTARVIGAVFGQRSQLWWDLPARESFAILRDIFGVRETDYRARLREFDDLLELSSFWETRVCHLSLGQRMRCDLAAALLHDPPVVFLDEPTIGMDVVVKEQVRTFLLHQVAERDRAVLLTTHDMTEVARLAERVILINHGRIVHDGPLHDVRLRFGGGWRVRATLAESGPGTAPAGLRVLHQDAGEVLLGSVAGGRTTPHEALKLVVEHYQVSGVSVEEGDLEDVMRAAYLQRDEPDLAAGPLPDPVSGSLAESR